MLSMEYVPYTIRRLFTRKHCLDLMNLFFYCPLTLSLLFFAVGLRMQDKEPRQRTEVL